jgi:isoquinoline 1-oxidoreductase subunit beta
VTQLEKDRTASQIGKVVYTARTHTTGGREHDASRSSDGRPAALHGEITLKDGRVQQTNFDTYQMLRMNEAPAIEVHIVQSAEPPGGMGEAGTSAIVPAVTNAIFAATGKRLRKMPVDVNALKQPA